MAPAMSFVFAAGLFLVMPARSEVVPEMALAGDDECSGDDPDCALNAIQFRGTSLRGSDSVADQADPSADGDDTDYDYTMKPDFEVRPDDALEEDGEADGESEDEEEDSDDETSGPEEAADGPTKGGSVGSEDEEAARDYHEHEIVPNINSAGLSMVGKPGKYDTVPTTGCYNANASLANPCPSGMKCAVRYDKQWSQCMTCEKDEFARECQKLDNYMRYAAVHMCKQTCLDTMCYNKNWCLKPYKCVYSKEDKYGQCISCRSKKFWKNSCFALKEGMQEAAKKVCHKRCHR